MTKEIAGVLPVFQTRRRRRRDGDGFRDAATFDR
jgi:hypothetical protein